MNESGSQILHQLSNPPCPFCIMFPVWQKRITSCVCLSFVFVAFSGVWGFVLVAVTYIPVISQNCRPPTIVLYPHFTILFNLRKWWDLLLFHCGGHHVSFLLSTLISLGILTLGLLASANCMIKLLSLYPHPILHCFSSPLFCPCPSSWPDVVPAFSSPP